MSAMHPVPFRYACRLVQVLYDLPPTTSVVGTETDFTFLCRHRGRRSRNRCQIVVVEILKTHRADHHKLPYAVVGICLLGPVRSATGYPIDAVGKQFTKLSDAEIWRCAVGVEVAYQRQVDHRFHNRRLSAGISDLHDIAHELLYIKELRNWHDLLCLSVDQYRGENAVVGMYIVE